MCLNVGCFFSCLNLLGSGSEDSCISIILENCQPLSLQILPFFHFFPPQMPIKHSIRLCCSILHIYEPLFYIFHLSFFAAFRILSWNFMLIYSATFSVFPPTCLIAHQHPTLNSYLPQRAPPPGFPVSAPKPSHATFKLPANSVTSTLISSR